MVGILAYGSLMHPESIEDQFGTHVDWTPVWLSGYRRHYGQESEWRTTEDGEHGNVLTVDKDEAYRCNVVALTGVERDELTAYREREEGYNIATVEHGAVHPFNGSGRGNHPTKYLLPIGEQEWRTQVWRPLNDYLEHCEEGAAAYGEAFRRSFAATTFRLRDDHTRPHPTQ